MTARGPLVLARYSALAWCVLIVYASLHPFAGWRDSGASPLDFLDNGWPRYWTVFDLAANVVAYVPIGFFLTLALSRLPGRWTGAVVATLLAALLSGTMEALQTWLPSRVPSHLDLACNALGGLIGALVAQGAGLSGLKHLESWLDRHAAPVPHAELGLTLLGLWLFLPLSPEILLFGAGDLRHWLPLPAAVPYAAASFPVIEAGVTACNMLAVGLLLRFLCARSLTAWCALPLFFAACLAIRTLAAAILIQPADALAWLTPGTRLGLLLGAGALVLALVLLAAIRLAVAASALLAGTALVNLAPANPYSAAALAVWQQGHFLNFNGLTRLVATLWPFLTLPFLLQAARRP